MTATTPAAPTVTRDAQSPATDAPPRRDRLRRLLPLLAPLLLLIAGVAVALRYGLTNAIFLPDEYWAVTNGRSLNYDGWDKLFDETRFDRGPERLHVLVIGAVNALVDGTPGQLRVTHALFALAHAAAALPIYALARGLRLERWQAALIAVLGVVTPWLLFATTLLNVNLGFPLTMAFVWAVWRAVARPGVGADALVVALAVLNALARTGHLTFAALVLPVALYGAWLRRPAGERSLRSLALLPLRTAREHLLLTAIAVLGVLVVVGLGPARLIGQSYAGSANFDFPWIPIWHLLGAWTAELTLATGILPMMIGGAWALREVVRPRSPETGIFAMAAVSLFLLFVYVTGSSYSVNEERYVAVLAGLPVVAFGAAIFTRRVWLLGTLLVGAAIARAIAVWAPQTDLAPFNFFIAPTRNTFSQVTTPRLEQLLPPALDGASVTIAVVLMVAAALVAGWLFTDGAARRVRLLHGRQTVLAGVLAAALGVVGLVGGAYALRKYDPATLPGKSLEDMAWIEELTGGEQTMVFNYGFFDLGPSRNFLSLLAVYFNENTCCFWVGGDLADRVPPAGRFPWPEGRDLEYLARFEGYSPVGFYTEFVGYRDVYASVPYRLIVERFKGEPLGAFTIREADPDGALSEDKPVRVEMLPQAQEPGRCLRMDLHGAPENTQRVPYELTLAGRTIRGRIGPDQRRSLVLPVRGADEAVLEHGASPRGRRVTISSSGLEDCR